MQNIASLFGYCALSVALLFALLFVLLARADLNAYRHALSLVASDLGVSEDAEPAEVAQAAAAVARCWRLSNARSAEGNAFALRCGARMVAGLTPEDFARHGVASPPTPAALAAVARMLDDGARSGYLDLWRSSACDHPNDVLAHVAFDAYNDAVGGRTHDGRPIPPWHEAITSKPQVGVGWRAAVKAAVLHALCEEPCMRVGETFGFGPALAYLRTGARIRRAGWSGRYLDLQLEPDGSETIVETETCDGQTASCAWLPTVEDVTAADWSFDTSGGGA